MKPERLEMQREEGASIEENIEKRLLLNKRAQIIGQIRRLRQG